MPNLTRSTKLPAPMTSPAPPDTPPHLTSRYPLLVRFCETDLMGIVHHASYLTYFEAGRIDWLHRRGVAYLDWAQRGIHLPVAEARLKYSKPARFDEALVVETTCRETSRVTVRFTYRVLRGDELLCNGETLLACVGPDLALMRIPDDVLAVFQSPETHPSI